MGLVNGACGHDLSRLSESAISISTPFDLAFLEALLEPHSLLALLSHVADNLLPIVAQLRPEVALRFVASQSRLPFGDDSAYVVLQAILIVRDIYLINYNRGFCGIIEKPCFRGIKRTTLQRI